jgi:hypothetical protein
MTQVLISIAFVIVGTVTAVAYGCMTYTQLTGKIPFYKPPKPPVRPTYEERR